MISSPQNNSPSLEDRHFLSDPRPVPDLDLPTWEVDVYREGVENPILTLRVDSKVLPPRRKKKKTLWKLPDSVATLPKFGEQDKRRIFELFREKKKELKKLKNKQRAYRRASSMEAMSTGSGGVVADGTKNDASNGSANGSRTDPPQNGVSSIPTNLPTENGRHHSLNGVKTTGGNDNRDDDASLSPPGFQKLTLSDEGKDSTTTLPPAPPPGISSLKPSPPGLPAKIEQQQPPNGLSSSLSNAPSMSSPRTVPPPGIPQSNGNHPPPLYSSPTSPTTHLPPGLPNGHHPPRNETPSPPRAIGPCFVLPPDCPPDASMGKFVTETYYLLLRNGMIRDLDAYYFQSSAPTTTGPGVHKAVTVGGAHAVCASQQDRLIQLQTFAACEMRIKGVQQQPTVGNGLLVLVTGVSIRTTTAPDGQAPLQQQLPFCQTLILTPVSTTTTAGLEVSVSAATTDTVGYQILNDNLVILTGDE